MRGTTRRPLAAERRVDRPRSEETGMHRVGRYKGARPSKELRISARILNRKRFGSGSILTILKTILLARVQDWLNFYLNRQLWPRPLQLRIRRLKMQQPMNANPVQVVVLGYPAIIDKQIKYRNMKTYLARQLIALGILQLIIGILCIIFQGVALGIFLSQIQNNTYLSSIDFVGHGFWTGLMFLITGSFGIAGGIKRKRYQVVTFNVLSILSAAFATCLLAIAISAAIIYTYGQTYCGYTYYTTPSYNSYYNCYTDGTDTTGVAMETLMAILALIEGIIAIWSSVICCTVGACCCSCGGSCCCPQSPIQNQFLMTGQPFPGQQQTIFVSQQQLGSNQQHQMVIPNQQHPYQQLQLPSNQQQPLFLENSQQPIINLDPGQHVAQYIPQQPGLPSHSEQPSPYTALSPASRNEGSNIGLYTAMRDTLMYPEQNANSRNLASSYYETPAN